ncbi:transcription factor bHLH67-like [Silene latifolia]|uniref:transcription factor bHLH67-like n=1 Tax=Silene latifolia TaxID=37657 RepID=UPI003D779115
MEKLQGPINPCLVGGEDLDMGCWLEEFVSNIGSNYKFEDPYSSEEHSLPTLEDKMPFLQMLQGAEAQQQNILPFMQEPNYFQLLLRLQHQKMMINDYSSHFTSPNELENSVKSESLREQAQVSPQQCNSDKKAQASTKRPQFLKTSASNNVEGVPVTVPKERRKRKRPVKPTKNQEEVETQRRTHIAVERNRRRQMNDHLNALRSLMPPSYVQRGDQASIIGGAIDFVKEMEQLLESLQAQKRLRQQTEENNADVSGTSSTSSSSNLINNMFLTSPTSPFQLRNFSPNNEEGNANSTEIRNNANNNEEFSAENRSALADIKVVVIQNHVNLKIQCQRRPGQLLKVIMAFEELRLTILHLNITSLHTLVHYSFNLKIEDDCKLGSAEEVVRAVHHIFSMINLS